MDAMKDEDRRHCQTERLASVRHYSALRFAILTVFLAATGGLVQAWMNRQDLQLSSDWFIPVAGMVVAVVFGLVQGRISVVICDLETRLGKLGDDNLAPIQSHTLWSWIIGIAMCLLNALVFLCWIYLWASAKSVASPVPLPAPPAPP
jgi:uncharacterized BrkB/YihY/UPF0761 family membrane protein